MKGKTSGKRGLRSAAALAAATATAFLMTACGAVHVHFGSAPSSAPATPAAVRADIAYGQCMRTHGFTGQLPVSPDSSDSSATRANAACKHLLPNDGTATAGAGAPPASGAP